MVTSDEIVGGLVSSFCEALDDEGITVQRLVKLAKKELNAKSTKTVKLKGAVQDKLPRGVKNIAVTGVVETKDEEDYGTGETLLLIEEINWTTRQKARMDMNKLRGDYPAEKHKVELDVRSLDAVLNALPEDARARVIAALEEDIFGKRI